MSVLEDIREILKNRRRRCVGQAIREVKERIIQDFKDKGWYNIPSLRHLLVKELDNALVEHREEILELVDELAKVNLRKKEARQKIVRLFPEIIKEEIKPIIVEDRIVG